MSIDVKVTISQEIDQQVMGQEIVTKQEIVTLDRYAVEAVTPNGYRLKTTGLSRVLSLESPQVSMTMDSSQDGDEHLAFRAISGKSFFVEISKTGRVLDISGLETLRQEVESELSGTNLEASAGDLLSAFEPGPLASAIEGQLRIYPEPGESWAYKTELSVNNLPVSLETSFRWGEGNTILAEGVLTLTGDIETNGMVVNARMAGNQDSSFQVEETTGLPTVIDTTQSMVGALTVGGMEIPMAINTVIETEMTLTE